MKKTFRLSLLLFFLPLVTIQAESLLQDSPASASGPGKVVAVTAEKEVDIAGNDVGAARTMALALAARDAVEKAYGTYIKLEETPEARTILAKAAAGLKYSILAEQKRGNRYWVKIQAYVTVPQEYAGDPVDERETMGDEMQNFVQKYPQGEINWGEGFVVAFGSGEITEKGPNAEELAARAAEIDAKAHLLEIINDIPLDDRMRTGEEERISFALEGFVQDSEVVARSKSGTIVKVTVQAPLRGVKGLTMTVYGYYTPERPPEPEPPPTTPPPSQKPAQPPKTPQTTPQTPPEPQPEPEPEPDKPAATPSLEAESYTGVVIDARKAPVASAIFPKVEDTEKRQVYGVTQVNKEDLQKRGMASYAVVARDVTISKLFPRALVIPVLYSPDQQTGAAESKTRRRQGYKPLVVTAADAGGKLKTNLIISEEDARKLKALDEKTGVLKECRVVVVVSSEVGGVEGKLKQLVFVVGETQD